MDNTIIVVFNEKTQEYFFAEEHSNYGLGDDWIPMTTTMPIKVSPRVSLPSGLVTNKEEYKRIFCVNMKEIESPKIKRSL